MKTYDLVDLSLKIATSFHSQTENGPSTSVSKPEIPPAVVKLAARPPPALAGACDLTDIKTLLREWVTTITGTQMCYDGVSCGAVVVVDDFYGFPKVHLYLFIFLEPMEEDILQVVKYCTDLIEDKDLEKLDLTMKYMKRLVLWS